MKTLPTPAVPSARHAPTQCIIKSYQTIIMQSYLYIKTQKASKARFIKLIYNYYNDESTIKFSFGEMFTLLQKNGKHFCTFTCLIPATARNAKSSLSLFSNLHS